MMPGILRELLWALLYAALSLPVLYLDPVRLRRISFGLAVLVFVASFLLQKLR